jgi:hypothetical protein
MIRPIRSVETYFENGPRLHIPRVFAEVAFLGASDILQAYAPIHLQRPREVHLPASQVGMIDVTASLPDGATSHRALLTRRDLKLTEGQTDAYEGMFYGLSAPGVEARGTIYTRVTGEADEDGLDLTVGRLIHEFGHSYNLGHCALPTCVMAPIANRTNLIRAAVSLETSFCDAHAEELEQSGWRLSST